MIPLADFIPLVSSAIPRFQGKPPNKSQQACILHPTAPPLMIVAGPGSGKTTVLVLRALRFVFVDGFLPEEVLMTTFTKKAAGELRSRLIDWGLAVRDHLLQYGGAQLKPKLERVDINRFTTGTLDAICEDTTTSLRQPNDPTPVLLEAFVANAILRNDGLFPLGKLALDDMDGYLADFTFSKEPPRNMGERLRTCRSIVDRLVHDQVTLGSFSLASPHAKGRQAIASAFQAYRNRLAANNQLDFAALEELFLARMKAGKLTRFTDGIKAVLVDEYQDTNPLQEEIYFEVIRQNHASLTVVGDDDQSLYRFRGATVELFRDFVARFKTAVAGGGSPKTHHLVENYRSTPEIVEYVNSFVTSDPQFQGARVKPPKPTITAQCLSNGIPVLGMFRDTPDDLADSLADFLKAVFTGTGYKLSGSANPATIIRHPKGGDYGDCVLLGHTVNEYKGAFGATPPKPRLPKLLRDRLAASGVGVFNPRGRALRDIPDVQIILGLMLECIDENAALQSQRKLRHEARDHLLSWRSEAKTFVATNPPPNKPTTLAAFVGRWSNRHKDPKWPREWPLLELFFKLLTWFPSLRDEPEGQVYVESIARCITQASVVSTYRSQILHGQGMYDERSVNKAIEDIFAPLAEQEVDVDEDIMPHVPRNRLAFMTIHQAKGLEFPLVIVDVGSDLGRDHPKTRGRRFPVEPSPEPRVEDDLAAHSAIGPLRKSRTALERSFDDLVRLYYVAFSRPQSVLLLVGLTKALQYKTTIRHVATGWLADGTWTWKKAHSGKKPPGQANNIPIELI